MKSILTATIIATAFGAGAKTVTQSGMLSFEKGQLIQSLQPQKIKSNKLVRVVKTVQQKKIQAEYLESKSHQGEALYIIRLVDGSIINHKNQIPGLPQVKQAILKSAKNNVKFNLKSASAIQYQNYLETKQNTFVSQASAKHGIQVSVLKSLKYAINGMVTKLTHDEALALSKMPEVAFVEKNRRLELHTNSGPEFIGAGEVWDGTAADSEYKGEGITIGIIDTGVNTDHRSFAATGDDGYTVSNPMGEGVYLGDCTTQPQLCNSKLIGVRSYPSILAAYAAAYSAADSTENFPKPPVNGEDYGGHGSHTASTAGGNVLLNVPHLQWDEKNPGPTGDGVELEIPITYPRMSGVAPHANIISYQVCMSGKAADGLSGCDSAAIVSAIDDAIADEVDVINYSIGGPGPAPWEDAAELGFLNANEAGIFVATSAGNSGPGPRTTTATAAWYTSVGAVNHRSGTSLSLSVDGIGYNPYYELKGSPGFPAFGITAPIVYAGADNSVGCSAFTKNFFAESIALIGRGTCDWLNKVENASAAGAVAVVIFNQTEGDKKESKDVTGTTVPSIIIPKSGGADLIIKLIEQQKAIATIVSSESPADTLAGFSSRGPANLGQIISPQVAAPGVGIYAASADEQFYKSEEEQRPADFGIKSGTSMASPHVAGAAALVMQAHPDWDADQVRSSLMMTATTQLFKEDGETPADSFDMGAGRIQVDKAINAGLIMTESKENYLAANPKKGGLVRTLNIPSMANYGCADSCSWTRTFTAVKSGSYTITTDHSALVVSPSTLYVTAGQDYTIDVNMDLSEMLDGSAVLANVFLAGKGQVDLHLPVYARKTNLVNPKDVNITTGRNDLSLAISDLNASATSALSYEIDGLYNVTGDIKTVPFEIAQDPTPNLPNDNLDDVFSYQLSVPAGTRFLRANISDATAGDNELFIYMDSTGDGSYDQLVGFSATSSANETVEVAAPAAGEYRVIVQNYAASTAGQIDRGNLSINIIPVTKAEPGLTISADKASDGFSAINPVLVLNKEMQQGQFWYANVTIKDGEKKLGSFAVNIARQADDVTITTDATLVGRGEPIDYKLTINPSIYQSYIDYSISVDMPEDMILVAGSVVANNGAFIIKDANAAGFSEVSEFAIRQDPKRKTYSDPIEAVHVFEFEITSATHRLQASITKSTSPDFDLYIEYDSTGDGTGWRRIAAAATPETNETALLDFPPIGKYRALVQNFTASGLGAKDTGTLTVTTTPALGNGFLFSATTQTPETYSAVSSIDDATCASSGLRGRALAEKKTSYLQHVPLSLLGSDTLGVGGDSELFTFNIKTEDFFGEKKDTLSVSTNGFITYSNTAPKDYSSSPSLPNNNIALPKDMIAGYWKDLVIVDDGSRGIRTEIIGPYVAVDFAGAESKQDENSRYTFNILTSTEAASDDHQGLGPYEVIISYAANQVGNFKGATSGVENSNGTAGIDTSSMIIPGEQICFDKASTKPIEVHFQVIATASYKGKTAQPNATIETNLEGTKPVLITGTPVELITAAHVANAGADATYDRNTISEIRLNAIGSDEVDQNLLGYHWEQTAGNQVIIQDEDSKNAFVSIKGVANGSYTFELTVKNSEFYSSDSVTITLEGESDIIETDTYTGTEAQATTEAKTKTINTTPMKNRKGKGSGSGIGSESGSGSLGFMMIFMGLILFTRRKLK